MGTPDAIAIYFSNHSFQTKNYEDDIMDIDANADDDDDTPAMNDQHQKQHEHADMTSSSDIMDV